MAHLVVKCQVCYFGLEMDSITINCIDCTLQEVHFDKPGVKSHIIFIKKEIEKASMRNEQTTLLLTIPTLSAGLPVIKRPTIQLSPVRKLTIFADF